MDKYLAAAQLYWVENREAISTTVVLCLASAYMVYRWIKHESGGKISPSDRWMLFWLVGIFVIPIALGAVIAGIILILLKFFGFIYSL